MSSPTPLPVDPINTTPARQTLNLESPKSRSARLGNLFASLSTPPATPAALPTTTSGTNPTLTSSFTGNPSLNLDLDPSVSQDRQIYPVAESSVLARARAFLPLLQSSNSDLLKRAELDPRSVDIENTSELEQIIAMDLGLGVYDLKGEVSGDLGPMVDMPEKDEGGDDNSETTLREDSDPKTLDEEEEDEGEGESESGSESESSQTDSSSGSGISEDSE